LTNSKKSNSKKSISLIEQYRGNISLPEDYDYKIEIGLYILKKYNKVQLYDVLGKKLLELNNLAKNIDVSSLKSGLYIIQFYNGEIKSKTIKIIKK
jgi:hypothetical protein